MHVVVVGAGAAGLGAAWKLMESGAKVTLLEASDHAGGRCHSVHWHGDWRITGAMAFISIEDNLKEQASKLGTYNDDALLDMSGVHEHEVLVRGKDILSIPDFEPETILRTSSLPMKEKLALAKVLPKVMKQMLRNDWRDPTPAADFDNVTAAEFFRKHSPTFVDYMLEPIMQHFNGFSHDEYSLGWIVWILAGQPWSSSWWTFKERGVGRLTYDMASQLSERDNVEVFYNAQVDQIRHSEVGAEVDYTRNNVAKTIEADAVVCAVPGSKVNGMVQNLDADQRAFFDKVQYGPLYLSYYLVKLPEGDLPQALILPTADGFETTAYYNIQPGPDGLAIIHAEMKGKASLDAKDKSDEEIKKELWDDVVKATPAMANCEIRDFLLIRNDIAIMKPYVGYLSALKKFKTLPKNSRLAFAGDYLITSTVGQAHYTGLKAAEQILQG